MSEPVRELLPEENVEKTREMPMQWHRFLVKYLLYVQAAVHILQAVWVLSGRIYYTSAARDAVYASMPALRIADYALACALLAVSALLLAAWGNLKRRNRRGIRRLNAAYSMLAAAPIAHMLARYAISALPPLNMGSYARSAASLILLLVNAVYYHKRRELFE